MKRITISITSLLLLLSVSAAADEAEGKAGYRSDLWKMEFHQEDEEQSVDEVTGEDGDSASPPTIDAGLDVALDQLVANTVADRHASATFIAETTSTDSMNATGQGVARGISRQLPGRRMGAQSGLSAVDSRDTGSNSNGPSLLTLFVALVAGVVITSAVFR